jgi:hypothetical protein
VPVLETGYVRESTSQLIQLMHDLKGRATPDADSMVGAPFDERLDDSIELVRYGEEGVALENLIQNLYEYDVTITQDEATQLARWV